MKGRNNRGAVLQHDTGLQYRPAKRPFGI